MPNPPASKSIDIKIATVVAVCAILHSADLAQIDAALRQMTGGQDDFFDDEFAVLDVGALDLSITVVDWIGLVALLKSYRLHAVAVRNVDPALAPHFAEYGLSVDRTAPPRETILEQSVSPAPRAVEIASAPRAASATMLIDTPVRAGQRIYARDSDLIITAVVNNGAEVIADGSIHIYAPLRGRALAGASGNASARIFAFGMEPELVSIAGVYRTFEDGFPAELAQQPAQVRLIGDRIDISALEALAPALRS